MMYEDDIDYAIRRLNNTLVRTEDGHPFYITSTFWDEDMRMKHKGQDMVTGERREAFHNSLNLEPVPLGFINTDRGMVFVARKPMRRDWRQGLSHNSLVTFGKYLPEEVNLKWLCQPILQNYPTLQRAIEQVDKKGSVAFSREFGLSAANGGVQLFYRQYPVGQLVNDKPILAQNKEFLQQHLEEAMG